MNTRYGILLCALVAMRCVHAAQPPVQSVSKLSFADAGTLFVADWKGARIFALPLPAPASPAGKPFNLKDVQAPIAKALGVAPTALRFEDLAVQPGSEVAYVALTVRGAHGQSKPAIVSIDATGKVRRVDLSKAAGSVAITDAPTADMNFWRDLPEQTLSMTVMNIGGEPTLVAAYTCTPLVTIPLKDLKDGAHITAHTVSELGWGSAPNGLVSFQVGDAEYALQVNSSRSADLLRATDLASAAAAPGLTTPIEWPAKPYLGVKATMTPMSAVMRIDNLNQQLLLALRRSDAGGEMQLVSIPKSGYLRLSDFVNEYDFPNYR